MRTVEEKISEDKVKYFGVTDKGKTRFDNQDAFEVKYIASKSLLITVLCDGMGGQNAGALASEISVGTFMENVISKVTSRINKKLNFERILIDACDETNTTAYDYSNFDPSLFGMGTTIVGSIITSDGHATIISVGDSRCYLLNAEGISQITTDHSLVEDLIRSGAITREQAKTHKQRSIITRAIGSDIDVDADLFEIDLKEGNMLMFCSDGLTNYVSDYEIYSKYLDEPDPEKFCTKLIELTYEHGAGDNVTIISVVK